MIKPAYNPARKTNKALSLLQQLGHTNGRSVVSFGILFPPMTRSLSLSQPLPRRTSLLLIISLLLVELIVIGTVFKHGVDFDCKANWPRTFCTTASSSMVAIYCVLALLVLLSVLRPAPVLQLIESARIKLRPVLTNLTGVIVTLLPVTFMQNGVGTAVALPAFALWGLGVCLMFVGAALCIASTSRWKAWFLEDGYIILPAALLGALAPWLAVQMRPIWTLDKVAELTFGAVTWLIGVLGYDVLSYPVEKVIGTENFLIEVAPVCSGIEGIALVTLFVTIYLVLFRSDLRFPVVFLLYPIGWTVSALLNVVRITALLAIGIEGHADLAVGGFHSHAGWLMFTLVAIGIIALANTVSILRRQSVSEPSELTAPLPPLWKDPIAAQILPFGVFMATALLASTFSSAPGVIYPLRVLFMIGIVAVFWPIYRQFDHRLDFHALAVGAAIGLMWVLIPVPPSDTLPYGTLSGGLLLAWFVVRGIGTIFLVPLIEELFFRNYLEKRLAFKPGLAWKLVAALVTALLFALLHDRWAEAFIAGLAFSWVARRQERIMSAVQAHAIANAIVFAVAAASGNMAII